MRFKLLGPFEIVTASGRLCTPRTPKVCQVLALTLATPNKMVSVDLFIQEIWGEKPPRSAMTTLQTYIYHVRKMFARELGSGDDRPTIVTHPSGYLIQVDEESLDVTAFERLVQEGRRQLDADSPEFASRLLREALDLWRGTPLSNVPVGPVLEMQTTYLTEVRIRAAELRVEAEQRLNRHRELIPELRTLVREYPYNEWFHGQLINSLSRSGRRAEALQVYQELRQVLDSELGLDPSAEVQQQQQEVLRSSAVSGAASVYV